MADHVPYEMPIIIAVMGLPYTFREEMGLSIALWAKVPNLKFEPIFNALPNEKDVVEGGAKEDVAFNVLFQMAMSQLDWPWPKPNYVVINFLIPSKCKSQLEKLLSLCYRRRLLIIECRRRNKFQWETYVKNPWSALGMNLWTYGYNQICGEWKDVEKAILEHQQQGLDDNYFLNLSTLYPDAFVSRLVVDTFRDLRSRDFTRLEGLSGRSLFAEAIKYILAGDKYKYQKPCGTLDYALWRRKWLEQQASSKEASSKRSLCEPGDCILRFAKNLEAEAICEACDKKVTEGAYYYYCQLCSLSLHESCGTSLTPHSQLNYCYRLDSTFENVFPQTYACHSCEKEGKPFSFRCNACIFRTHLKCQLLPTALKHRCEDCDEDHILSIRFSLSGDTFTSIYHCKACGLKGCCSSYCCNICNSEYHLQCLLGMPLHTEDVGHGGHMHIMKIKFSCNKEDEYEWCLVCYKDIDSETWVYTCQDCDYVAHLYCIFPSEVFKYSEFIAGGAS